MYIHKCRYISEGLHPRIVVEGFEMAKTKALEVWAARGKGVWGGGVGRKKRGQ